MKLNAKKAAARVAAECKRIRETKNDAGFANQPFPEGCASEARKAEAAGEWLLAAAWYEKAAAVTMGHSRSAMYNSEEKRCLGIAKALGEGFALMSYNNMRVGDIFTYPADTNPTIRWKRVRGGFRMEGGLQTGRPHTPRDGLVQVLVLVKK